MVNNMADDSKYVRRVRGKLASRGRSSKADRMRQYNKQTKNGTEVNEHDYCQNQQARPQEFTNASDIDIRHIGENVEVGSPWFQGRRVVELDVLARSMNCEKCNSWLHLSDIMDEVVYGMASYLYITCQNSVCRHISLVPTGKKSSKRGFDVNYKVYLGN